MRGVQKAGGRSRLLLAVGLLAYAVAFQGSRGLFAPDEGRYVVVALEMLREADWIHPRLHPETPHYTKPPLTYWALASSFSLFGRSEWAARLPNTLAFAGTVLLMLGLGRRLGRRLSPALVYATCAGPYLATNIVTTDTLLTFFETLAGYAFVAAWQDEERRERFVLLLWAAFALAFLTKGPPGLLPLPALAAFVVLRRGWRGSARFAPAGGILLFVLLGLSWYVKVALDRPELWHTFLAQEVLGRVATAQHKRNAQWYAGLVVYGVTFLAGALPWTIVCLLPIARLSRAGPIAFRRARSFLARDENLLPALWLLVPLLALLFARSRLSLYALPLFVPLCLLLASLFPRLEKPSAPLLAALGLWAALLAAGREVAARLPYPHKDDRHLAAVIESYAGRPKEVVFVGTKARYGVGFYLETAVQRLATDEEMGLPVGTEMLEQEWREPADARQEPRAYLVLPAVSDAFERTALATGRFPQFRGAAAGYDLYVVVR